MRKEFQSFRKFDENRSKQIWDDAVFVFDTNVLLNLYRYPSDVADELMSTISIFKDKIWMPHNVALEFYNNRLNVIADQRKKIEKLKQKIYDSFSAAENFINSSDLDKKHSHVRPDDIFEILSDARSKIDEKISQFSQKQIDVHEEDIICDKIESLYENNIGRSVKTQDDLDKLYDIAAARFEQSLPPGYKDTKKEDTSLEYFHKGLRYRKSFGDYIIWHKISSSKINTKMLQN
jgi:hypothetical protein